MCRYQINNISTEQLQNHFFSGKTQPFIKLYEKNIPQSGWKMESVTLSDENAGFADSIHRINRRRGLKTEENREKRVVRRVKNNIFF